MACGFQGSGGRGGGVGGGGGRGRGKGRGRRGTLRTFPTSPESELASLKAEVAVLEARLRALRAGEGRVDVRSVPASTIMVDAEACIACGFCVDACPTGALSVDEVVQVDGAKCIGCAVCVEVCPCGALSLHSVVAEPRWSH